MMKCKNKPSYGGLSLILTSIVFIIIFSTMCIIGLIISFLYNNNLFSPIDGPKPLYILIFIAILSIIIGSVLTFIFSKIPLKPINKLITATKELSNGNFDIRINFDHPKELKELSNSFNNMAKELGSVELLRNDFVNNFSHEFKTPIVSLRGFAKLLKNDNLTKEERDLVIKAETIREIRKIQNEFNIDIILVKSPLIPKYSVPSNLTKYVLEIKFNIIIDICTTNPTEEFLIEFTILILIYLF